MRKLYSLIVLSLFALHAMALTEEERDSLAALLATGTGDVPTITNNARHARGATMAFARFTVSGVSSSNILEEGLCWSTTPEPTVLDDKSTLTYSHNGTIYAIKGLKPSTVYYVRPYAITRTYAVGYGDDIQVITIPQSTSTYELDSSVTGASADIRNRITEAMNTAFDYWRALTSICHKDITVYYNTGVPTAEASYSGYLAFGANSSYQRTGTALHEMAHTAGIGQTSMWINSSVLHPGSGTRVWLGERANEVVRFIENNDNAGLTGDNTHMWGTGVSNMLSYGINGAHEDSGSELQYIAHCLVLQGCTEDGMCPDYWTYIASPSYTLDIDTSQRYFLTSESKECGQGQAYLTEKTDGSLTLTAMNGFEVQKNDNAAWQFAFNPATQFYTLKNVGTGHYLQASYSDGISMGARLAGSDKQNVQLMKAREDVEMGSGTRTTTHRGYWLSPNPNDYGCTMIVNAEGKIAYDWIDLASTASAQRWIVLPADEMDQVAVNSLNGTLASITINDETVPGVQNEYQEFNYAVAPGTEVGDLNVEAAVKEAYPGTVAIEMPTSIPGVITVKTLRNGADEETYIVNVEENLLYNWNGRNAKNITPLDCGWQAEGSVTADVVNGADSTFRFVDADSEAQLGYTTNTGKTFSSNRVLEMPFLSDESYKFTISGLTDARTYDFVYHFAQLYKEGTSQVSLTTTVYAADGTVVGEAKRTYGGSALKKFKKVTQTINIPKGTTGDLTVTFEINQSCRHILSLGEFSITDKGEYISDAVVRPMEEKEGNGAVFNLQGMRLDKVPQRGIYIQNGKKMQRP